MEKAMQKQDKWKRIKDFNTHKLQSFKQRAD